MVDAGCLLFRTRSAVPSAWLFFKLSLVMNRLKCKERDDVEVRGSVCSCMFLATSSSPRRFRLVWNEIGRSQPILRRKPSGPWGDLMTTTISTRHSRCSGAFGRILQTDCIPARPTSSCNNIEIVRLIQDAKAGYWRS
ncbi:hypothetical protein AcV7_006107 [Taiwanofungus camphoratus]|nr:hypothetical protein AcV7_006107 [Antrodia cinnamomea]